MYQGMSDCFYGPTEPVPFPDEAQGIDFEGEFGVVVDAVPMGTTAADALPHIKLIVQINDWSLRALALSENEDRLRLDPGQARLLDGAVRRDARCARHALARRPRVP